MKRLMLTMIACRLAAGVATDPALQATEEST